MDGLGTQLARAVWAEELSSAPGSSQVVFTDVWRTTEALGAAARAVPPSATPHDAFWANLLPSEGLVLGASQSGEQPPAERR